MAAQRTTRRVIDRRSIKSYLALASCVLLFSVCAVLSFEHFRLQHELAGSRANAVLFAVASYERELLKALAMVRPQLANGIPQGQDTFRTQLEIIWSRLNLFTHGTETRRIQPLESFRPVMDLSHAALTRIEDLLDAGDITASDVQIIRAELEALQQPAHDLVLDSYAELAVNADYTRARLEESEWLLYGSFAGILLSSFALVCLLLRQIRTSHRHLLSSKKALAKVAAQARAVKQEIAERNRAENEVRRLNHDLERLVDERTVELRESQAQLVRKERLATIGLVTATVSHELRNPLGTIRASLVAVRDRIADGATSDLMTRNLDRIDRSVRRCDLIIDEMLDFSRSGALNTQATEIDLWLSELLTEYAPLRNVALRRELHAGIEVEIDRERLRRALLNILENAVQAITEKRLSTSGHGNLGIVVHSSATDGRLEIVVEDTGPGVRQGVLPRVFDPLVSTKSFGVGLGLPNARSILRQHGGDVELRSTEGEGATVTLWFPVSARPLVQERAPDAA